MGLLNVRRRQQGVGHGLVHADGGGFRIAAHKGDAGELEQSLDGAVLAIFAVEGGEDHVHRDDLGLPILEGHQSVDGGVGGEEGGGHRTLFPSAGNDLLDLSGVEEPFALFGDAHHVDVVFIPIQILQNGSDRHARDLML